VQVQKGNGISHIRRLPNQSSWELNNPLLRLSCWWNLKFISEMLRANLLCSWFRKGIFVNNSRIKLLNMLGMYWLARRQNFRIHISRKYAIFLIFSRNRNVISDIEPCYLKLYINRRKILSMAHGLFYRHFSSCSISFIFHPLGWCYVKKVLAELNESHAHISLWLFFSITWVYVRNWVASCTKNRLKFASAFQFLWKWNCRNFQKRD
jgi:hypothetical protein